MSNSQLREYGTKEDIEIELFQPLNEKEVSLKDFKDDEDDVIVEIFGYSTKLLKVIKEVDGKWILADDSRFYYSPDKFMDIDIKVGDYIISEYERTFTKLEDYQNIKKELKNLSEELIKIGETGNVSLRDYKVINPEKIQEILTKALATAKNKEDERQLRLHSIETQQQVDANSEFKKTGKYENVHLTVDGNKLIIGEKTYELLNGGEFRGYFDITDLNGYSPIQTNLIDKTISFSLTEQKSTGRTKTLELVYEEHKTLLNGVPISKNKIKFILDRIEGDELNKELIARYNRLSGMKADLIDLATFEIRRTRRDVKVPIKVSLTAFEDTLKIESLGVQKDFNWAECKEYFFDNGKTRSVRNRFYNSADFFKFTEKMGLNKTDTLIALKRVVLVNSLGDKNGDDD